MSCFHPLHAVFKGYKENGKKDIVIIGDNECIHDDKYIERHYGLKAKLIEIPCGKCVGCRLEYSRIWANRCVLEAKKYEYNYFITLTYDNEYDKRNDGSSSVPLVYILDENGVVKHEIQTLRKKDLQDFFQHLRDYIKCKCSQNYCLKFRYYACGEYGEKNGRPHYHIILFNCNLFNDMLPEYTDDAGFVHYQSKILNDIWKLGRTEICEFSWHTAAYTARYVMKKHKGLDSKYYELHHKEPEFVLMSRRPGIGRDYFDENYKKIYQFDSYFVSQDEKVVVCKPGRYYDNLFDSIDHQKMEEIKIMRQKKSIDLEKVKKSTLAKYLQLRVDEDKKASEIKSLKRKEF